MKKIMAGIAAVAVLVLILWGIMAILENNRKERDYVWVHALDNLNQGIDQSGVDEIKEGIERGIPNN